MIHQLETMIAKSNDKLKADNMKWGKCKSNQTDIESRVVAALCQYPVSKSRTELRGTKACVYVNV